MFSAFLRKFHCIDLQNDPKLSPYVRHLKVIKIVWLGGSVGDC